MSDPKFDRNAEFGTVHGNNPWGAAYSQVDRSGQNHYYNGDYEWVHSDDAPKRRGAPEIVQAPLPGEAERLADVRARSAVAEPLWSQQPVPNLSTPEKVRAAVIADLQAQGVQVRDDGTPGDPADDADASDIERRVTRAKGTPAPVEMPAPDAKSTKKAKAEAAAADADADETDSDEPGTSGETPEDAYASVDPKKALTSWLKGELTDPKPRIAQWRGWATETLGQSYTTKADIVAAAVEQGIVTQEDVKV
jgi:hypothetical protein